MKLKVTEQGVFIPKELLGDSQEVEVTKEDEKIIITLVRNRPSIWDLGKNPVKCDVNNAVINHDVYLETLGKWEDDRTTEEIIDSIYKSRNNP